MKSVAAGMNPMDLKRGIDLAVTKVVEKTFTINRTEMRPITRKRWVTENVPRVIRKPQLKYVIEHIKRRAVKMVKELKAIEKEVPKTIPVPIGSLAMYEVKNEDCSCYKSDCDCIGQEGCDCCYPECKCAPSMISPTETEIIIMNEE
jgi:chaperonin GroEL